MFDELIVGAGTAGCVLAARLSEDPHRTVALLEAGPDVRSRTSMPTALRRGSAAGNSTGYDAGLHATVCGDRTAPLPRGRVMGGSAQVNGSGAWRAPAADFEQWSAIGLPDWGWESMLESYRAIETDLDFGQRPEHGSHGAVPITRFTADPLPAPMTGLLEAAQAAGHPVVQDLNASDAVGIGRYPQNRQADSLMSTNLTHLVPARMRENLTVRANTHVDTVEISSGRAVGVRVAGQLVKARRVILAAGVPMTPALLLRSGIGPAEHLREHGIPIVADRAGVGIGLYDQPGTVIPADLVPGNAELEPGPRVAARLNAIPGYRPDNALYLSMFVNPPPGGTETMCAMMIGDMNPSSRGTIRLDTDNPVARPSVDLRFYSAPGDIGRMRAAYRHAWTLAQHPAFTSQISRFLIDEATVADDESLDEALRMMTFSRGALAGGAAMGIPNDSQAVVDQHCRVYGLDALCIADLSIAPVALRSPTALDAMAVGEHAARQLTHA